MPTIVGILKSMSRINFVLSWFGYEKSFITSGPEHTPCIVWHCVVQDSIVILVRGTQVIWLAVSCTGQPFIKLLECWIWIEYLYLAGIFYLAFLVVKSKVAEIWDREIEMQFRILLHNKWTHTLSMLVSISSNFKFLIGRICFDVEESTS